MELPVARESLARKRSLGERRLHGAARLMLVQAVREAARARELGDVLERRVERSVVGPELELAHPGRVEEERAGRERDGLAVRCRVAAAAAGRRRGRREDVPPGEPVHERRLADARGAEQRDRPPTGKVRLDRVEALSGGGAYWVDGHAERDGPDGGEVGCGVVGGVPLVDDDRGVVAPLSHAAVT